MDITQSCPLLDIDSDPVSTYVLIPGDQDQPAVGMFYIKDGFNYSLMKKYAEEELGLAAGTYEIRPCLPIDDEFFDYRTRSH